MISVTVYGGPHDGHIYWLSTPVPDLYLALDPEPLSLDTMDDSPVGRTLPVAKLPVRRDHEGRHWALWSERSERR